MAGASERGDAAVRPGCGPTAGAEGAGGAGGATRPASAREAAARAGGLERAGRPEAAAALLQDALTRLGPQACLCEPLAALLSGLGRHAELADLARRTAHACADPRDEARWRFRLGEALEADGQAEAAAVAFHEVLAARPHDPRALAALQRLHRRRGDATALARVLELELARVTGSAEIPLRLELAELLAGPLRRDAEALTHLRRLLELEPENGAVLERALALCERMDAPEEQLTVLERALSAPREAASRARLLAREAALLAGPLGRPEQAARRWREARQIDPALPGALAGLRIALERAGDWKDALACLHEEAQRAGPEARLALLRRGAELAAAELGPDASLVWLERMRALAPRDPEVWDALAALHREAGRDEALAATLETRLALEADPDAQRGLLRELAGVLLDRLGAPARAWPVLQRALALAPEDGALRSAAERCRKRLAPAVRVPADPAHCGAGRVHGAPDLLPVAEEGLGREDAARPTPEQAERELASLDPASPVLAERRRALHALLGECRAGTPDAIPHLRALSDDPGTAERERARAEVSLRALLRRHGAAEERAERLVRWLGRRLEDGEAWLELGELRLHALEDAAEAASAFREALARGADAARALAGLRESADRLGDAAEVARTLERELALLPAERGAERNRLLRRLGQVTWRELGATTRATRAFAAALEADPGDRVSLHALQELLLAMEDWRGALDLFESEIELLGSAAPAARRTLWLRAARLAWERAEDPARALRALDAAHAIAPLSQRQRVLRVELLDRLGERSRFVEAVSELIDAAGAREAPRLALRLARALLAEGRTEEARRRVKLAIAADARSDEGWALLAEVELARGARAEAAACLLRASEASPPALGVSRLLQGAALAEGVDAGYADSLLARAVAMDPGSVPARTARARSTRALGRAEEAEREAAVALELALAEGSGDRDGLCALGLELAGEALDGGRPAAAARLLAALRVLAPDAPEVLRTEARARHAVGDLEGAARAVEALRRADSQELGGGEERIRGEGLEARGALPEAAAAFRAALARDPECDGAWEGLVRVHERSGDGAAAAACLERWAAASPPWEAAPRWVRAAELRLAGGSAQADTERCLRAALALEPTRGLTWLALVRLRADAGDDAGAERLARAGLGGAALPALIAARLHELRAHALEQQGRMRDACLALAAAVEADPDAAEAALGCARILRGAAAWRAAAEVLERHLAHAVAAPASLRAEAWLELGRLRAGPLQALEAAAAALREAVRLRPALREAREELADLLLALPGLEGEALTRQRALLEADPTRHASLLGLCALAERCGASALAHEGHAIVSALDRVLRPGPEPPRLRLRVAQGPTASLEPALWERARQLALTLADEISDALGASRVLEPPPVEGALQRFRMQALLAEAALAGPALVPLGDTEAGAVLAVCAALACDRELVNGPGHLVNQLSGALGMRARHRARALLGDTSPEEIAAIDYPAWRSALRARAGVAALDATGGALLAGLEALVLEAREPGARGTAGSGPEAVARTPAARELLRRVVARWAERIRRAQETGGRDPAERAWRRS